MHKIHLIISAATTAALVAASGVAMAQPARASATAPSAAAAPAVPMGPPVANMCIFSNQGAIAQSAVGKYVVSRLQQIQAQVQAADQGAIQGMGQVQARGLGHAAGVQRGEVQAQGVFQVAQGQADPVAAIAEGRAGVARQAEQSVAGIGGVDRGQVADADQVGGRGAHGQSG